MKTRKRIAIIGGGPVGLEAALQARAAGHDAVVYERGEAGESVNKWGFLKMFTSWKLNTTPLGRVALGDDPQFISDDCPTGGELVERYLQPLSESAALEGVVETGARVLSIGQPGRGGGRFSLLVTNRMNVDQMDHADVVIDASGTYGNRRWIGRGDMPAAGEFGLKRDIWYTVPDVLNADRPGFAGRQTLLIGSGTSAANVLMALSKLAAEVPGTKVIWCFMRWGEILKLAEQDPLPARRALVESVLRLTGNPPAWLEMMEGAYAERITAEHGLSVTLRQGDRLQTRHVDSIIAAIGYRPDETLLEPLQLRPRYADALTTQRALGYTGAGPWDDDSVRTDIPGFYLVGAKSFGTNSNFLLPVGYRQAADVIRLVGSAGPVALGMPECVADGACVA